jgi:hypothetical protein
MGSRAYSRRSNGRFRRATLENTFGLSAPSCPACQRLNPHVAGEPAPEHCHACGAPMSPAEPVACPDGGTCHHDCTASTSCFRVEWAGPLSGVYPGDHWPADVLVAHIPTDGAL